MQPSIVEAQVFTALGNLLLAILPAGVTVAQGQVNRVSSPLGDFIEMWPLTRPRLATNLEIPVDTQFTASITNAVMTVTAIQAGSIDPTNSIFGVGLASGTVVEAQQNGTPGGVGVYLVTPNQNVSSQSMSAGVMDITTSTEFIIQCDVHGPNSGDNAQVISNIIRSSYAVDQMDGTGVTPLYSDDPRQAPFDTGAKQYEERWTVDVHLQIKPTVSVPQEFSDSFTLTVVDVDVAFPAD